MKRGLDGKSRKALTQQSCEAWYYRMPTNLEIFVRDLPNGPTRRVTITKRQVLAWLDAARGAGKDRP